MSSVHLVTVVTAGALVGLGVFLLVAHLMPAPPALGPALHRLHPVAIGAGPGRPDSWVRRQFRVPHADLRLLGRTVDAYFLTLGLSALFALFIPLLLGAATVVLQLPVPIIMPIGASLATAVLAVWLAHRDVIAKAETARGEFTRAVCTYLDLSAHQVLGGHGPVESLTRAASVCHGWVFTRIREALLSAELQLRAPWDELKVLGRDIEVIELGDLADIMRTAGNEGANVYQTLRARADSLRDQLRTQALAEAEVRTNKLDIPASAMILVLLVLMGYPFLTKLFVQ
jgi:tight adherence protein C